MIDDKLVEILQKIRDHFGVSVNINSGYRCPEHSVKALQQLLIANGYHCGATGPNKDGVDGSFGGNTQAALIHYQTEHSLPGDGVAGPATMASLLGLK